MVVFISWSGERSRLLAEELADLLRRLLHPLKPWMSASAIQKGDRWFNQIGTTLSSVSRGIICVTPENQRSPWLLFEAGALAKSIDESRVCPILLDMAYDDLEGPLTQFQSTVLNRADIFSLLQTLNNDLGSDRLEDRFLEEEFDAKWPQFESRLKKKLGKVALPPQSSLPEVNQNIQEIFPAMTDLINRSLATKEKTRVVVLGLTLYHMWEYLKNYLNRDTTKNMHLDLLMIADLPEFEKRMKNNWVEIANGFANAIEQYKHRLANDLEDRRITIRLARYCELPWMHGILVNDEHLFLSYTSWNSAGQLEGPTNFYCYYDAESDTGIRHMGIFRNWLAHLLELDGTESERM